MLIFGFILAVFGFLLNLNAPSDLSYASKFLLVFDFVGTIALGKFIINKNITENGEYLRHKYYGCFLVVLGLCLLYLFLCWTPYLSPNTGVVGGRWGFDPQRYYWFAKQYILSGSTNIVQNYMGIVEFYRYLMLVFGIDPMVPLFVNMLAVLFGLTSLSATFLRTTNDAAVAAHYIPVLFFIPEVIAYGVMSSREVLSAAFSTICLSYTIRFIEEGYKSHLLKAFVAVVVLFVIRPPFGITAIGAIGVVMVLNSPQSSKFQAVLLAVFLGICTFSLGIFMNESMGSNTDVSSLGDTFSDKFGGTNKMGMGLNYSDNSVAAMLIPHNPVEFIVFGVIRCVTYLIPKGIPIGYFTSGNLYNTFDFFAFLTSALFMIFIPALWWSIRNFRYQSNLFRCVTIFLVLYLAVVGLGISTFIQDRYRIVFDFLYLSLVILSVVKMGGWRIYKLYAQNVFIYCIPLLVLAIIAIVM